MKWNVPDEFKIASDIEMGSCCIRDIEAMGLSTAFANIPRMQFRLPVAIVESRIYSLKIHLETYRESSTPKGD